METLNIQSRRVAHLKREAVIGILASTLSVFVVLPYLDIRPHSPLSENYLDLFTTPVQIFVYLVLAVLMMIGHLIIRGIFYNINDISPKNRKSILINQFIYGAVALGFAYFYCSRPSKFNAGIFERYIDYKETFYLLLFFFLFYWVGNLIYFFSKRFKKYRIKKRTIHELRISFFL